MEKVNQKMKKFTFRGVIDGFRSTVGNNTGPSGGGGAAGYSTSALGKAEIGVEETINSEHFQVAKVR